MDALHCRRDTAQAIVERGGDYVLAVKDNQPGLLRDAKAAIAKAEHNGAKQATTTDADHDRKETRTAMGSAGQRSGREARLSGARNG